MPLLLFLNSSVLPQMEMEIKLKDKMQGMRQQEELKKAKRGLFMQAVTSTKHY